MPNFSWLHFTDLHQGLAAQGWLWPNVREVLLADLTDLHARCGPWDLVLFTGDLTQHGTSVEFTRLNETLQVLWDHFRTLGSTPALIAVPGNHDLIRPDQRCPEALILGRWEFFPEPQKDFWEDSSSPYRALVKHVFDPYTEWLQSHPFSSLPLQRGMLPGDCSTVLTKDGFKFGVVGLNSAFLQLGDGDYLGRLALDVRQFHAACGGDGPAWCKECDFALLMTHHPPTWLQPRARDELAGEIAPPGRFVAHLFGHMHEGAGTVLAVGGAQARRELQGSSLFGLEVFGDGRVDRRHGYTAARLTVNDKNEAALRLWPRAAKRHPAGHWRIVQDLDNFELGDDQGTRPEPLPSPRRRPRTSQTATTPSPYNDAAGPHQLRTRILKAIRQRHDMPCFAMKGLGRLKIPLAKVWLEPSLRFTVAFEHRTENTAVDQPSVADARCSSETLDLAHPSTLDAWIQRRDRAHLLKIFGEMGSGKSVTLLHQEGKSLARAEQADDAPLPLLVEAKEATRLGLIGAVAKRLKLPADHMQQALDDQALRFLVLLDGADEVRSSAIEEVLDALTIKSTNIEAVVVTSRPSYRFPTFHGEEAVPAPWKAAALDEFLECCRPWAEREVEAVHELQRRQPLPFLENPLAASLCLLIAHEEARMLRNRSWVIGVLVEHLFDEYVRERTDGADLRLTWEDVAPIVYELAYEALQSGSALTLEQVHRPSRRLRPNLVRTIEGFLQSDLGIFVPTDLGYEFALRGIAEFLAGQHILSQAGGLLRAANTTWGQEPVRHAIVWQHAVDRSRAEQLLGELLDGEQDEAVGLEHHHLRRVLVALLVACDLGDEVPCADRLAEAAFRRLNDERSIWVGEKVADVVRGLAQGGGPVFKALLAAVRESLAADRVPRADFYREIEVTDNPNFWLWVLLERDPGVRLIALSKLEGRSELEVHSALANMLFDEGDVAQDYVANRSGQALRTVPRGPDFEILHIWLLKVLRFRLQLPSCAAAIALRPDEAPLEELVLALERGIGNKYAAAADIAATPAGRALLDAHWPKWQERSFDPPRPSIPPVGAQPAPSREVKWRFARAVAPGLRFADVDTIDVLLRDSAILHTLTHDFDIVPTSAVVTLIERMHDRDMCPHALAQLTRRIEREPALGETLIERGRALPDTEIDYLNFPGRALEGLIRGGHKDALELYVRWLPRSGYARGHNGTADFPDDLIRRPEVTAALAPQIAWACSQLWRNGPAAQVLARFPAAWQGGDAWDRIARLLHDTRVPFEATHWYALIWAIDCLRHAEIPTEIHAQLVEILGKIMVLHPTEDQDDEFFWHHYMHHVLRFIADRGLVSELAGPLLALCGIDGQPVCGRIQLHALCTTWPLLDPQVRVAMSAQIGSRLHELSRLDEIPPAALRGVIEVASATWSAACERFTDAQPFRHVPLHPQTLMIVLELLPSAARHATLKKWLPIARQWCFPWISYNDRRFELRRPIDEAWRLVFDAGLDPEID